MRSLLLRSLLVAVLIGPPLTFVSTIASVRPGVKYEPGISQDEFRSYDNRTVSDLQAFLKSREVKFTRYHWLRESVGYAFFWKGIALSSVRSCIGIFLGCVIMGILERRRAIPLRVNDATVPKKRTLKRHWGRLLWVAVTNLPVFVFSIYVLKGVYQDDVRNSLGNPPHPSFWDVLHDNPSYAIALFLAGIGLLLETIRRREAGFVNCGLWLMVSIYSIAVSEPIASRAVVIGIFVVSFVLYFAADKARLLLDRLNS